MIKKQPKQHKSKTPQKRHNGTSKSKRKDTKKKAGRRPRGTITGAILASIQTAGALSIALVAPNALQALEQLGMLNTRGDDRYYIRKATTRLKKHGYITFSTKKGKTFVELTKKGEQELIKYQLRQHRIKKPLVWDGRYRVLIFDITEKRRDLRDKLRKELHNLGFYMLQQSVWVHPYNCEDVVILLKAHLGLGWGVHYLVVERIDNDKAVRKHFNLL